MADRIDRLRLVCAAAGLEPVGEPRQALSWSNDAWLLDDRRRGAVVLRIGWRGDVDRLEREAVVSAHLPAGVRRPEVLAHGRAAGGDLSLTWSLSRRLAGEVLATAWASLDASARRSAIAELARMLRELHRWRPPDEVVARLRARPALRLDRVDAIVGSDGNLLPVGRALAVASLGVPGIDAGLLAAAVAAIEDLRHLDPPVDDAHRHGVVHGDLHLHNLWVDGSGALTIMDFEWVRLAPPVLELLRLCDSADEDALAGRDRHPAVLRWIAACYPELFEADQLVPRLRLQSLTYAIRDLVTSPEERLVTVARLRRLVDGAWPAPGTLPV